MSETPLLIITGLPCTGKTTLGIRIAQEFHVPFLSRDTIKEHLFETLGWKDRTWSKQVGIASYSLLHHLVEVFVRSHCSCILESNFQPEFDTAPFQRLQKQYGIFPIQIVCHTDGQVLFERFKRRSASGERHPGHVDHLNYQEFEEALVRGEYEPLDIGGEIISVNTTIFDQINYQEIFDTLRRFIGCQ